MNTLRSLMCLFTVVLLTCVAAGISYAQPHPTVEPDDDHTSAESNQSQKHAAFAGILSGCIFPGIGQVYNSESISAKALGFIGVEISAWALMFSATGDNVDLGGSQYIDVDGDDAKAVWGLGLLIAGRLVSALDAVFSAEQTNKPKPVTFSPITNKRRLGAKLSLSFSL